MTLTSQNKFLKPLNDVIMRKIEIAVPKWNVEEISGYKPMTSFWQDFSIADAFGITAVADTFKRAFNEWKGNYKYLTELVMVLNHKIWQWYEKDKQLAKLYNEAFNTANDYALDNLYGSELTYFYCVTD